MIAPIPSENLPDEYEAKEIYERVYNGNITEEKDFGIDLLEGHPQLQARHDTEFSEKHRVDYIYRETVNERPGALRAALLEHIRLTGVLFQEI